MQAKHPYTLKKKFNINFTETAEIPKLKIIARKSKKVKLGGTNRKQD